MDSHHYRLLLFLIFLLGLTVKAGPPFFTDDPEPVPYHQWEAYFFSTLDAASGNATGQLPALEINTGAAPNLQLHLVVPATFSAPSGLRRTAGFGDVTVGAKFRFIQETENTPQIGIFPAVVLPLGDARRGLGNGGTSVQLPLWMQKSKGPWTTYGGVGYTINRSPGGCNYCYGGWLVQRDLTKWLMLGGEVFTQGRTSSSNPATTILNTGGQIKFPKDYSLLFSVGHSVSGADHLVAYLGLYRTWGGGSK